MTLNHRPPFAIIYLIATFVLITNALFGQTVNKSKEFRVLLPQLDSMVIDFNRIYLNTKNIKGLYVLKDPDSLIRKQYKGATGTIVFKTLPQLVALNSLKTDKFSQTTLPPVYFIDGLMVADTTGVKIDKLNVKTLEAVNSDKNTTFNKWSVVYLVTTNNKGAQAASNKVKRTLNTKLPF
jgi:hypothetical protein